MQNKLKNWLKEIRDYCVIKRSGLFDCEYYLHNNLDVARSCVNPIVHYIRHGWHEGRNPNPYFDTKWYLKTYPDVAAAGINPLYHYLKYGAAESHNPLPNFSTRNNLIANSDVEKDGINPPEHDISSGAFERQQLIALKPCKKLKVCDGIFQKRNKRHTILLCAHLVGKYLFGSEISFIDILKSLYELGYDIVVLLPKYHQNYITELFSFSYRVYVLPYKLWSDEKYDPEIVRELERIIEIEKVSMVHVNTIMIREPLIAARNKGVLSITHVRELITGDDTLINFIRRSKEDIIESVIKRTDYIIANSEASAKVFIKPDKTFVVPNTINLERFDFPNNINEREIKVALISSNIPKKGIFDFVEIAKICRSHLPNVKFLLIGPDNEYIEKLKSQQRDGALSSNIVFAGYKDSPEQAILESNIVVNVSNFSESFGRTVLEAMAARRPVVAYDYGAISELVEDGANGFLVPYKDLSLSAERMKELCKDTAKIKLMGETGREIACARYSNEMYKIKMGQIYEEILKDWTGLKYGDNAGFLKKRGIEFQIAITNKTRKKITVIIPNYNYSKYLKERINSIVNQTYHPSEIVFLDDASSDDSVSIAQEILSQTQIPYKIITNKTNNGVYKQWLKGIGEAQSDYIWIAEADDTCNPEFLNLLINAISDENVVLSYCQSQVIDENGHIIRNTNLFHTDALDPNKWKSDYKEIGVREVVDYFFYRNSIPNVSACLIKRSFVTGIEDMLCKFKGCGDWLLYSYLLSQGDVSFVAEPLNSFRRHSSGVTRSKGKSEEYLHELMEIKSFIAERFPIHLSQIDRMIYFLDKDYTIEGISKNSKHPDVINTIDNIKQITIKRKKLVFITMNDGSHNGGSEVLWIETAKRMRQLGHDVIVLIKKWDQASRFFEEFHRMGIKLYFKEDDGFKPISNFNPDLVVISLGDQDEGTGWFEKCKTHRVSYVIINQLTKEEAYWPIRKDKIDVVRKGYLGAEKVFFTCRNNIQVMEKRIGCSIPNAGIHYNPYHIDRNTSIPFPSMKDGIKLAIPARLLMIHKGQNLIIELLKEEKWRNRNITVNLYGEGPDEQHLKSLVQKYGLSNVHFHERQKNIIDIWRVNHAILLPSFMEGLPIVLVGAMVCARVPIVTDIGGHREVIDDNINGFIAATPFVTMLDDALERALAQRDKWEEVGKKAREKILDYLPDDPVEDFISQLYSILDNTIS